MFAFNFLFTERNSEFLPKENLNFFCSRHEQQQQVSWSKVTCCVFVDDFYLHQWKESSPTKPVCESLWRSFLRWLIFCRCLLWAMELWGSLAWFKGISFQELFSISWKLFWSDIAGALSPKATRKPLVSTSLRNNSEFRVKRWPGHDCHQFYDYHHQS